MRVARLTVLAFLGLLASAQHPPNGQELCSASTKTKPPKGSLCNYQGVQKKAVKFLGGMSSFAPTVDICRDRCISNSNCSTLAYHDSLCYLYGNNLKNSNISPSTTTGIYYWNIDCFSATYYDPTPIKNGDFRTCNLSPWTVGFSDPNPGDTEAEGPDSGETYQSPCSLYLTFSDTTYGGARVTLSQDVLLCRNLTYELSLHYYLYPENGAALGPDCEIVIPIDVTNTKTGGTVYSNYLNPAGSGDYNRWVEFTDTFAADGTSDYSLGIAWGAGCGPINGTVLFDDIALTVQK